MFGKYGGLGILCGDHYCLSSFKGNGVYRQMEFFHGEQAVHHDSCNSDGRLFDSVDACFPYRHKAAEGKTGGLVS